MDNTAFPACCSAQVIYNFGGGHEGEVEGHTKQAIIDYLTKTLDQSSGRSVVFACVTSTQPNAIAALTEVGFYGYNDEGATTRGNEDWDDVDDNSLKTHRMFPFFMPMNEWLEGDFKKRYDPKKDTYENQQCKSKSLTYKAPKVDTYWNY